MASATNPEPSAQAASTAAPSYSSLLHTLLTINTERKIRLGIQTTRALLDALGPQYDLDKAGIPTVHVAGSNGKGSVATKIAKAFALHGLKVGLYTSPHVSSYRERIQINEPASSSSSNNGGDASKTTTETIISESSMCSLVPHILRVTQAHSIPATFFELGTALAFGHFIREKVDLAVIEVGLGGRLDSTNVLVGPELSIITSIALEHTAWLGDTIEKITREKAGIVKKDRPVLIGPNVDLEVVKDVAGKVGASDVHQCTEKREDYDEENSEVAKHALRILQGNERIAKLLEKRADRRAPTQHSSSSSVSSRQFDSSLVHRAMKTRPPCRFQRVRFTPGKGRPGVYVEEEEDAAGASSSLSNVVTSETREVVLDVCHNPAAFQRLFEKMRHAFPSSPSVADSSSSSSSSSALSKPRDILAVVGFSSDKDFLSCLSHLMSRCRAVYVVSADTPRAATVEDVLGRLEESGLREKHRECSVLSISPSPYTTLSNLLHSPPGFLASATHSSSKQEEPVILCCGTFFIMADVRRALQLPHPVDEMQINEQSMKK
jgi:dihydrofolate synthase/folylpolyglutamate synthase